MYGGHWEVDLDMYVLYRHALFMYWLESLMYHKSFNLTTISLILENQLQQDYWTLISMRLKPWVFYVECIITDKLKVVLRRCCNCVLYVVSFCLKFQTYQRRSDFALKFGLTKGRRRPKALYLAETFFINNKLRQSLQPQREFLRCRISHSNFHNSLCVLHAVSSPF